MLESSDWKNSPILHGVTDAVPCLEAFFNHLSQNLPLGTYRPDPGFLCTKEAVAQAPHCDFAGYWSNGQFPRGSEHSDLQICLPYVLHLPLTAEGLQLNFWPDDSDEMKQHRVQVDFGGFLLA